MIFCAPFSTFYTLYDIKPRKNPLPHSLSLFDGEAEEAEDDPRFSDGRRNPRHRLGRLSGEFRRSFILLVKPPGFLFFLTSSRSFRAVGFD